MRLEVIVRGLPDEDIERAPAMLLAEPISFWGGVSPISGALIDPRSRHHNRVIAGAALFISELRGSSSASSVLLELIHRRLAPAAIILDCADAILALGAIVGREMGWKSPPILRLPVAEQRLLSDGAPIAITRHGHLTVLGR
ncbi:MAG: aconitase X swivel domain-containing protein [Steroidobacteraceae bacterium]